MPFRSCGISGATMCALARRACSGAFICASLTTCPQPLFSFTTRLFFIISLEKRLLPCATSLFQTVLLDVSCLVLTPSTDAKAATVSVGPTVLSFRSKRIWPPSLILLFPCETTTLSSWHDSACRLHFVLFDVPVGNGT